MAWEKDFLHESENEGGMDDRKVTTKLADEWNEFPNSISNNESNERTI